MAAPTKEFTAHELLIAALARRLEGARHVVVGALSPIPAAAALLAEQRAGGRMRVTMLGSPENFRFSDGGRELFDVAGQGRVDAFFLSGGQIDGAGNVNLVGTGAYPKIETRFPGSFGSAYLYYVVPKVILFREEHSRRVLVPKVDFISAPGTSPPGVYRPGGPSALLTNMAILAFEKKRGRFRLESVHPGYDLEEVEANTGFDFDPPADMPGGAAPSTPAPDAEALGLIHGPVVEALSGTYPEFAAGLSDTKER